MPAYSDRFNPPKYGHQFTEEVKSKRTKTAKHFRKSRTDWCMRVHQNPIHYWNQFEPVQSGDPARFREIDHTLVSVTGGWSFAGPWADYLPEIPTFADEWMKFTNLLPEHRGTDMSAYDSVQMRAPNHVAGVLVGNTVEYQDAYDPGISLIIEPSWDTLSHKMRIEASAVAGLTGDLVISTQIQAPVDLEVVIDGQAWDRRTQTITASAVQVRAPDGELTHLRQFQAWDSSDRIDSTTITAQFRKQGNTLYFEKIIPIGWIQDPTRVFPIYTDALISPNPSSDDAQFQQDSTVWNTVHDSASAKSCDTTTTTKLVFTEESNKYYIGRIGQPYNTSSASGTVTAADVNFYVDAIWDQDNDSQAYIGVVQLQYTLTSTPTTADWDLVGDAIDNPTQGATGEDISNMSASSWTSIDLNATGIGWIDVDGWTGIGLREGHDIEDLAVADNVMSAVRIAMSGHTNAPYLDVTYTPAAATFLPQILSG